MARALLRAARLGSSWVPERPAPSQAARRPALEALPQEDEATSELAAVPDRGAFRLFRKPCAPRPRRLPVVTAVSRRPAVSRKGSVLGQHRIRGKRAPPSVLLELALRSVPELEVVGHELRHDLGVLRRPSECERRDPGKVILGDTARSGEP